MRYDGTDWVDVGVAGFSGGNAFFTSLAFSPANSNPYVAFEDYVNSSKATVMEYAAPTGIRELQSSQISIYPNPTTEKITVE
jgi:hypothetical protein